jgi:hypothetical protein
VVVVLDREMEGRFEDVLWGGLGVVLEIDNLYIILFDY